MAIEYDADGKIYRCRIGKALRRRRQELGYTITEISKATGTSFTALSYWELEKSEPTVTNLYRICQGLGVTVEELIREE